MAALATVVTCLGIVGLLLMNRDPKAQTSPALWFVVVWMAIAMSRPVSTWLSGAQARSEEAYLEGSPFDRNVFTLLVGLGLITLITRAHKAAPVLRSNTALLLFLSYCATSILWSDYPDVAFKRWIKAVGDVVMVLLVLTERDPAAAIKCLFARIAFVFAPLSLLFIIYYGHLGRQHSRWEGKMTFNGVAVDKNMLGMACLVLGLALFWRIVQEFASARAHRRSGLAPHRSGHVSFAGSKRAIVTHGVVLAMIVFLLVISNSITSLGCFVLASVLMIAVGSPKIARRRGLVHALVVTIISLVLLTLFVDVGALLLQQLGRSTTLTGRIDLWRDAISFEQNPLFGTGFESFWLGQRLREIWLLHWWQPNQAHNGYLEIYLTLGWVGIGLLALVAMIGYRNILNTLRYDPALAQLRLAYFVVAIAYNLTETAFRPLHPVWLAFLLAVIAVPKPSVARAGHRAPDALIAKIEPASALSGADGRRRLGRFRA